jgi:hypothetical protein
MDHEDAERRLRIFERSHGSALVQLASHAALPVVLNPDFVHLLRVNYFLDPPASLPYAAEAELLLSPLCTEVDQGLYVIDPDLRDVLLHRLIEQDGSRRLRDVARLLWEYGQRSMPWLDRPGLSEAQQLTALNFIDPARAQEWLARAAEGAPAGTEVDERWFVAMRQDLEDRAAVVRRAQEQEGPGVLPATAALCDELASRYPGRAEAMSIAHRAGIDIAYLSMGVPPATLWEQILSAAQSSHRLPDVLEIARREAPLDDAIREYWIRLSPALRVEGGHFETPPPEWQVLEEHREQIERTLGGLCLITTRETSRDSRRFITGFLAGQRVVLTYESLIDRFTLPSAPAEAPGVGVDVWLASADRHPTAPSVPDGYAQTEGLVRARVTRVETIEGGVSALTLEVAAGDEAAMPPPLPMAAVPLPELVGRKVYLLGYPSLPDSRVDPAMITRIFGEASGVLRLQPGEIVDEDLNRATGSGMAAHNCFALPGNEGSPLVDLATGQVLSLHRTENYAPGPRGLVSGFATTLSSTIHERVHALDAEALRIQPGVASSALVFISYSRRDTDFLELLMRYLKTPMDQGQIQIFEHRADSPGVLWEREVEMWLSHAAVLILLVTPDYLVEAEDKLPRMLEITERTGAVVIPLLVRPSLVYSSPSPLPVKPFNPTAVTLAEMTHAGRETFLLSLAETVREAARRRGEQPPAEDEEPSQVARGEDAPPTRQAPVISVEQPEEPMQDLRMSPADSVRSTTSADLGPPQLTGRIWVSGLQSRLISAETVAADPDLRAFIEDQSPRYRFHLVSLAISFTEQPATPRLNSVHVALSLVSTPTTPEPIALSMTPMQVGDEVLVQTEIRIQPKMGIVGIELSPDQFSRESSSETREIFLSAMGLSTAKPAWEFRRTPSRELKGSHQLAMIVRAGADSVTSIDCVVTAQTGGTLRRLFRADLTSVVTIAATL